MRIFLDCIPCFIRQALDAARLATDDKQTHERVVRELLVLAKDLDMSQSPPIMGQKIHRLVRELVETEDPYRDVKRRFNNAALRLYPKMRECVVESEDTLETAIRLAIAGNMIDFGVSSRLRESELEEAIDECMAADSSDMELESFRRAVDEAEEILYIADNAGEIFFDRLLIEQLPVEKVTVVVKGSPVINDATIDDALLAGLPRVVEVIDNGSDAPGTILASCSQSFRDRFEKADLVVAKGQGNYETLSDIDKNIFFVLKAKCPVIAEHLGCDVGRMVLKSSNAFTKRIDLPKGVETNAAL
jgi:hypothetical protein